MEIDVHKNVLGQNDYEALESAITSDEFAWYFSPHHLENEFQPDEANLWHFTHSFYDDRQTSVINGGMRGDKTILSQYNSNITKEFESIVNFVDSTYGPSQLLRCKANLYTNQTHSVHPESRFRVHYKDHVDQADYGEDDVMIAIFSVGESNGGTVIGDTFYESEKNQLIVFNNIPHHGVSQKDTQTRICINYNFLKW